MRLSSNAEKKFFWGFTENDTIIFIVALKLYVYISLGLGLFNSVVILFELCFVIFFIRRWFFLEGENCDKNYNF